MNPSPQPTTEPLVLIDGPLFVFPDGSWTVLVSILAFVVSATTLAYTLSARSRVNAHVMASYLEFGGTADLDGDEVVIVNLGRTPAIIYDVRALTADGRHLKAAVMARGYDAVKIQFPDMPQTLASGEVLPVWFSTVLAGEEAGRDHGYVITYTDTGGWGHRIGKQRELTVKRASTPPPTVSGSTATS